MMARTLRSFSTGESLFQLAVLATLIIPVVLALRVIFFSAASEPTIGASISTVDTQVQLKGVGTSNFRDVVNGEALITRDEVKTSQSGQGIITFSDESNVVLAPGSQLTVLPPSRSKNGLIGRFSQSFGSSWAQFSSLANGGASYDIETPGGVVAIRDGAVLRVGVTRSPDGKATVQLIVLEGSATLMPSVSPDSPTDIKAGQSVTVDEGQKPSAPVPYVPRSSIEVGIQGPDWLLVTAPSSLATGIIPPGSSVVQVPLSHTTAPGTSPQLVTFDAPETGNYTLYLLPKGKGGPYSVTVRGKTDAQTVVVTGVDDIAEDCDWLSLTLHLEVNAAGDLVNGTLSAPTRLTKLPDVAGRHISTGTCGAPAVRAPQLQVTTPTATPIPVPTEVPTVQPTATPQPQAAAPTPRPTSVPPTAMPATPTPTPPDRVLLNWTLAPGETASQVVIYRWPNLDCTGGSTVIATVAPTPASYVDTGMAPGNYCYRIRARYSSGLSDFSNILKVATITAR